MIPNILVLVPVKPELHLSLKRKARDLAEDLVRGNPSIVLTVAIEETKSPSIPSRQARIAAVRNDLIARFLGDSHTHVLWIDADVVAYRPAIVKALLERCDNGMAAPITLVDRFPNWAYDTHGFARDGKPSSADFRSWQAAGVVHDLDSVGVFVLISADIYRAGARHEEWPGLTEWMSVGAFARNMGRPVRAFTDLTVTHAYLPDFGEDWH